MHNILLSFLFLLISFNIFSNELDNKSPNVLFIMVDDLRVELGSYGSKHAVTPNMDALAKSGTRFDKAYVSVPVCGASRASIATGMRATPDRFRTYYSSVEKDAPDAITLFQLFKENGYHTEGFGKIFHQMRDTEKEVGHREVFGIGGVSQDLKIISDLKILL